MMFSVIAWPFRVKASPPASDTCRPAGTMFGVMIAFAAPPEVEAS